MSTNDILTEREAARIVRKYVRRGYTCDIAILQRHVRVVRPTKTGAAWKFIIVSATGENITRYIHGSFQLLVALNEMRIIV